MCLRNCEVFIKSVSLLSFRSCCLMNDGVLYGSINRVASLINVVAKQSRNKALPYIL